MNKAELIKEVEKVTCTKKEAVGAVNAVFVAILKALKKGGTVAIAGFGTFKVAKRAARTDATPRRVKKSRSNRRRFPSSRWQGLEGCREVISFLVPNSSIMKGFRNNRDPFLSFQTAENERNQHHVLINSQYCSSSSQYGQPDPGDSIP